MIRVFIALIGVFIIWVLFYSKFKKERKIALVALAVILSTLGIWFESSVGKPRTNIIEPDQVINCGVIAKHSYRTNFDIQLCVQNTAEFGRIRRLKLSIIAEQCSGSGECVELQRVARDLSVDVVPQSSISLSQNLSFDDVDSDLKGLRWSFIVRSVKASQ